MDRFARHLDKAVNPGGGLLSKWIGKSCGENVTQCITGDPPPEAAAPSVQNFEPTSLAAVSRDIPECDRRWEEKDV